MNPKRATPDYFVCLFNKAEISNHLLLLNSILEGGHLNVSGYLRLV